MYAGSFRVSVIRRTPTWTAGPLSCVSVRDHSYACMHTKGLGTPTVSQHNIVDLEKLIKFFLCFWRISNLGHVMWSPTLYQLSHPITLHCHHCSFRSCWFQLGFQVPCLSCLLDNATDPIRWKQLCKPSTDLQMCNKVRKKKRNTE